LTSVTAQSFEFAHAGVIWAPDLVIRNERGSVSPRRRAITSSTRSAARFTDVVKNAYCVLLTRGKRGSTICILDTETLAYVAERNR